MDDLGLTIATDVLIQDLDQGRVLVNVLIADQSLAPRGRKAKAPTGNILVLELLNQRL